MPSINLPKSLNDVKDLDMTPAPPGEYTLEIKGVEVKTSKAQNQYLSMTFEITEDEEHAGKKVFDNVSLAENALFSLKALARSAGLAIDDEFDTEDFLGEQVTAVLDIEKYKDKNDNEKERNSIKRYVYPEA